MKSDKIEALVTQLNEYIYHYYVKDDPIVTDDVFDKYYDELVALEKSSGIILPNSPTLRVGGDIVKEFLPHTHINKLYSLDKCNSFNELQVWCEKMQSEHNAHEFSVEYKYDGLTVCLTYDNGQLVSASTRGNGVVGEDVTAQVLTIKTIPLSISYKGLIEIKGECIMNRSDFEKYNENATVPLKNPRNAAAGGVRNLDPKVTASRMLDFVAYDINYTNEDAGVKSQYEVEMMLTQSLFKVSPLLKANTIEQITNWIDSIDRKNLDFDIDGVVVKINDFEQRKLIGETDKFPKWAIAYKFEAEETTTIVKDVVWQIGRTGKLTPLAFVEPVELCGATISRATLNNFNDIQRKGVKKGSTVFIRRSNDVIPEILSAVEGCDGEDIVLPKVCPECGSELVVTGAHIFCTNSSNCPTQIIARLAHFASKECMDIDGLSVQTLALMYHNLNIITFHQLYELTKEQLLSLDKVKDKKAQNILKSIENSKKVQLSNFINALGINNVGKVLANDLAVKYQDIMLLKDATVEELMTIKDVGEKVALDIVDYFTKNIGEIEELLSCNVSPYVPSLFSSRLVGKKVVFTGKLVMQSRTQASKLVLANGGSVGSTISQDTDFLVVGESAGSKLEKAKKLGIKVLTESEFIELVNT